MSHRSDPSHTRPRRSRAPVVGPRMARGRAGSHSRGATRDGCDAVARVAVSDALVRMTEFGLRHASDHASGWWRRVEREMQRFVSAHLPAGAVCTDMTLDPERLEIVLTYRAASRSSASGRAR